MGNIERTIAVEGGIFRNRATDQLVTATRWQKDGDHPGVVRYPIEGRDIKGLLVVSDKEKYALQYGDWIVETDEHVYTVAADRFAEQYEEAPAAEAPAA